jgi:hypothetical protein
VDNGVTRRLGGDKPRHYVFDQTYRPVSKCQGSALPLAASVQSNRERNSEKANSEKIFVTAQLSDNLN